MANPARKAHVAADLQCWFTVKPIKNKEELKQYAVL